MDAWIVEKGTGFTRLGLSGSKRSIVWDRSFSFEKYKLNILTPSIVSSYQSSGG